MSVSEVFSESFGEEGKWKGKLEGERKGTGGKLGEEMEKKAWKGEGDLAIQEQ